MLPSIFKYVHLLAHTEDTKPQYVLVYDTLNKYLVDVIERRGTKSWGVQGHAYVKFKSWQDAAWALRDYYIIQHRYYMLICQLQENDGHLAMIKRMRHAQGALAIYRREVMKLHRDLVTALLSYSSHI